MSKDNTFKTRIKEERIRLNLKQEELGDKLDVKKQTIGKYEQGIVKPTVENLEKLADIFGCSTDYLLGRTDDRNNRVFEGMVNGESYTIEIDKTEKDIPDTPDKFTRLIKHLEKAGWDIDKLHDELKLDED